MATQTHQPSRQTKDARKNPKGGLTAKGREFFKKKEGANLKPGVTGKADTPEKMKRKGSFLRRHFAHPRGPMVDDSGKPTRLALSAHAWGEPVPKTPAAAKKLAEKGAKLLERYEASKAKNSDSKKKSSKKSGSKKTSKKSTARKSGGKKSGRKTTKKKSASKR